MQTIHKPSSWVVVSDLLSLKTGEGCNYYSWFSPVVFSSSPLVPSATTLLPGQDRLLFLVGLGCLRGLDDCETSLRSRRLVPNIQSLNSVWGIDLERKTHRTASKYTYFIPPIWSY